MVSDSKIKMAKYRTCEASKMETSGHWNHSVNRHHVLSKLLWFFWAVSRHG
jgi:hypothetical protein